MSLVHSVRSDVKDSYNIHTPVAKEQLSAFISLFYDFGSGAREIGFGGFLGLYRFKSRVLGWMKKC